MTDATTGAPLSLVADPPGCQWDTPSAWHGPRLVAAARCGHTDSRLYEMDADGTHRTLVVSPTW